MTESDGTDLPGLKFLTFTLTGVTPLLMHNERLANPMDPAAQRLKALTGKRKKTDEDLRELARAEFDGGLYIDPKTGPFVPSQWIHSMLRDAAKLIKLGTAVTQGVTLFEDSFPLHYKGGAPAVNGVRRTADWLWANGFYDQRMVGNQKARVLRTRPKFPEWRVTATIGYADSVFDERQLLAILELAGSRMGLGDYRPRFGRFAVAQGGGDVKDWI